MGMENFGAIKKSALLVAALTLSTSALETLKAQNVNIKNVHEMNIVNDSTKAAEVKLVPVEGADPKIVIVNPEKMNPDQLGKAISMIEEDMQATNDLIKQLSTCEPCKSDIPGLEERNKQNEELKKYLSGLLETPDTTFRGLERDGFKG